MKFLKQSARSYTQADIRQILDIALEQHSIREDELPCDLLLEIAQELQIAPDEIELAQQQWLTQQQEITKHQKFEAYRRSKLQDRVGKYAIVNACLIPVNLLTGFGVPWSLYVLFCWGIVRGIDAWRVLFQHQGCAYERTFQRWAHQQLDIQNIFK
jgi:2TM domain